MERVHIVRVESYGEKHRARIAWKQGEWCESSRGANELLPDIFFHISYNDRRIKNAVKEGKLHKSIVDGKPVLSAIKNLQKESE